MIAQRQDHAAFCRYLPFAVFMAFIGLDDALRFLAGHRFITFPATTLYYLYPVKTLTVAFLLYRYRGEYRELTFKDLAKIPTTLAVCGMGLLVFFIWIRLGGAVGVAGNPEGFNPELLPDTATRIILTLFRIGGAVMVVPLMEELFWRSFLIRTIIDRNFLQVPLGTFTWTSFLVTVALFGLEHNFILAGMMAGVLYNLILYRTRSLTHCVLAHAITNLALACYVLSTGKWFFW
jgi:CAAX protease family protein